MCKHDNIITRYEFCGYRKIVIIGGIRMNRGKNYIDAGKNRLKGTRYNIDLTEIKNILQSAKGDNARAVADAFYMGVEAGARISQKKVSLVST